MTITDWISIGGTEHQWTYGNLKHEWTGWYRNVNGRLANGHWPQHNSETGAYRCVGLNDEVLMYCRCQYQEEDKAAKAQK